MRRMTYFDRLELARRYDLHRPQVHALALGEIRAKRSERKIGIALDVACGTGHSATALSTVAPRVYACDVSAAMLGLAQQRTSGIGFVRARAEALPFGSDIFDIVTVSMAFHWLDQEQFIEEVGRVLAANGELWVYNFIFPGILVGDDTFSAWYREAYLTRYPVPSRHWDTLARLLVDEKFRLVFIEQHEFKYEVSFSASTLRSYLTTQSNVEAALQRGDSLRDIDAWLDRELAPFFEGSSCRRFAYIGHAEIAGRRPKPIRSPRVKRRTSLVGGGEGGPPHPQIERAASE
jgi:ubiquinone/menaquinone biosynthesis C-methylase UbiE